MALGNQLFLSVPDQRSMPFSSRKLTIMKTASPVNRAEESAPRTLKDLVQREAKTLSPETSVQEACDQLRSEKISSSPVSDQNGQLVGTVSESEPGK